MIYETLQICWHKVDDEPSHLSKTETLLSPRDVVCPADNSFREKQQQDQSAAPQELHSKKPTQLCLQSLAQSGQQRGPSHPFLGLTLAGVTGVCGRVDTDSVC